MHVYVVIAIDEDYRVKECLVISDRDQAEKMYLSLGKIWGGSRVCMASRLVDNIPSFNLSNLFDQEIDELIQGTTGASPNA